jgi:predicted phosphohydrolase
MLLGAAVLAGSASAQTVIERLPPGSYFSTQSIPGTECMCRGNGTFYNEGQRTCLRTATGRRLALCNKVLNVLNWEISENPCPDV